MLIVRDEAGRPACRYGFHEIVGVLVFPAALVFDGPGDAGLRLHAQGVDGRGAGASARRLARRLNDGSPRLARLRL